MVIILPQHFLFGKKMCRSHPPPHWAPFAGLLQCSARHFAIPPPPPSKHPGATHPLLPPQGISIARQRYIWQLIYISGIHVPWQKFNLVQGRNLWRNRGKILNSLLKYGLLHDMACICVHNVWFIQGYSVTLMKSYFFWRPVYIILV